MTEKRFTYVLASALLASVALAPVQAADDGSAIGFPFRINYLGYFTDGAKIALFLSPSPGTQAWELRDSAGTVVASGVARDYIAKDFASGDSFFRIDFSDHTTPGTGYRLAVEDVVSEPFDIAPEDPYGNLADEAFDYFRDHRTEETTFDQFLHNWGNGSVKGPFWNDAGDKGSYPTNTAMAAWTLMNLLERYPRANASFASGITLYEELVFGTELLQTVILPGQKLAIPKLHTHVGAGFGPCPPHASGPCVSRPETKATFAVARALAQLARQHLQQGQNAAARTSFSQAELAFRNAQSEPLTCRGFEDFGGEGGIYPDNDTYSIWREPKSFRAPCHPDRNNTQDDEFAALVEVYLAASGLSDSDTAGYARRVATHPRFGEISEFWWGAVAATANLSLLTLRPEGIDVSFIETQLYDYAEERIANMQVGYPGVTKDVTSDRWDSDDRDTADNNWRWGSNRMLLNDAIVLATAAEEKLRVGEGPAGTRYARSALQVMDYILGTNAMAISMVTGFGENAIERTHDCCVPDSEPGKMALGPNNWSAAHDPDMPAFDSRPGMKMMSTTGTGWASREISVDGNAPLVWMAWWARHRAAILLSPAAVGEIGGAAGAGPGPPRRGTHLERPGTP
jgi:hypothetical protein